MVEKGFQILVGDANNAGQRRTRHRYVDAASIHGEDSRPTTR